MLAPHSWKLKIPPSRSSSRFVCPLEIFLRLNFDGASKGNRGAASFGGLFRYLQGRVVRLYVSDSGIESNNEVEFNAIKHDLVIVIMERFHKVVVEGDSELVMDIIKKLQQGSQWEKMSRSWRISH